MPPPMRLGSRALFLLLLSVPLLGLSLGFALHVYGVGHGAPDDGTPRQESSPVNPPW